MRLRLALAGAVLLALLGLLGRDAGRAVAPSTPRTRGSEPSEGPGVGTSAAAGEARPLPAPTVDLDRLRDIFRYADEPPTGAAATEPGSSRLGASGGLESEPPPEPPVHLVGLVQQRGRLRVALSIAGEVVLLAAGQSAGGYEVLALDHEGVRLRTPDGQERLLPLP